MLIRVNKPHPEMVLEMSALYFEPISLDLNQSSTICWTSSWPEKGSIWLHVVIISYCFLWAVNSNLLSELLPIQRNRDGGSVSDSNCWRRESHGSVGVRCWHNLHVTKSYNSVTSRCLSKAFTVDSNHCASSNWSTGRTDLCNLWLMEVAKLDSTIAMLQTRINRDIYCVECCSTI